MYATGNKSIKLPLPGFDDDDVFYFKTLDDTRLIKKIIYEKAPSKALLVGSAYTNLELTDVLYNMKITPVILEKSATILP